MCSDVLLSAALTRSSTAPSDTSRKALHVRSLSWDPRKPELDSQLSPAPQPQTQSQALASNGSAGQAAPSSADARQGHPQGASLEH